MSSLLEIACRVEAAIDAYDSVREHTDTELWKKQLEQEKVHAIFRRFVDLISIFN
jgi:hypothetical protein